MKRTDIEKAFIEACHKNNIKLKEEKSLKTPAKVIDISGKEKVVSKKSRIIKATSVPLIAYNIKPELR